MSPAFYCSVEHLDTSTEVDHLILLDEIPGLGKKNYSIVSFWWIQLFHLFEKKLFFSMRKVSF